MAKVTNTGKTTARFPARDPKTGRTEMARLRAGQSADLEVNPGLRVFQDKTLNVAGASAPATEESEDTGSGGSRIRTPAR